MRTDRRLSMSSCVLMLTTIVACLSFENHRARAFSTGITGRSGRTGVICNECHAGGSAPVVDFEGPMTVPPGSTNTYRFNVRSQASAQIAAGLDIAVTAGQLAVLDGQNTRLQMDEVTHQSPRSNVDGVASWEFTWTAPVDPGTVTMFGAGNSVNLAAGNQGDRAAATTLMIEVAAAVDTPTPSPTPTGTVGDTRTPTPTLGPIPCVGDCDGNGSVVVNELVTGVNIALDRAEITECEEFDIDDSQTISVNELVSGVNALLRGCISDL